MDVKKLVQFSALFGEVEKQSYFDLSHKKRSEINEITKHPSPFEVEAWSFVPHPQIIASLKRLQRYIVTIDTIASDVYFPVLDFLHSQKANVTSYFSGGWADFVCDVQLSDKEWPIWLQQLREVLTAADAKRFTQSENGSVDDLISVFRVKEAFVVCGSLADTFGRPSPEIVKEIKGAPEKFELALRNYRSRDTLAAFNNDEKAVRNYLRRLRKEGAILCFRIVTNFSRMFPRDYVALRVDGRVAHGLNRALRDKPKLLARVNEFLHVQHELGGDPSEASVNHVFINTYEVPGDRIDWKLELYRCDVPEVNIYNYPLEGTVNETPVYVSEFPEFLNRARAYADPACAVIGKTFFSGGYPDGPDACAPLAGIGYGGVTLGLPNSGKTNTDLVLANSLLKHMDRVVVLDGTRGIWNKVEKIGSFRELYKIAIDDLALFPEAFSDIMSRKGLIVVEFNKELLGAVLDRFLQTISRSGDATPGNRPREIKSMLLVEEAADAWLFEPANAATRAGSMIRFLDETMRKGWSVWLSTQRASTMGPDLETSRLLLSGLKNRIVHGVDTEQDKDLLMKALKDEGHAQDDLNYFSSRLDGGRKGQALLRAVGANAAPLPPVLIKISLVGG